MELGSTLTLANFCKDFYSTKGRLTLEVRILGLTNNRSDNWQRSLEGTVWAYRHKMNCGELTSLTGTSMKFGIFSSA